MICYDNEAEYECIDCGKKICKECAKFCELHEKNYCVQKMGNIVIYECKGVFCKNCADFNLIHRCIECNIQFCNSVIGKLVYECPKCLNKVCPDCKEKHINTCDKVFDREKALTEIFREEDK